MVTAGRMPADSIKSADWMEAMVTAGRMPADSIKSADWMEARG
jgi:hypothetical protein